MIDLPIPSRNLPFTILEVTMAIREFKIPIPDATTVMLEFMMSLLSI
jgi:hypothetical protein